MPVLNGAHYITESVESILRQTYSNFELLVVDNGSTDDTLELIAKFKESRIRLLQEHKKGVFFALNKGISHSHGDFFARMDSDDIATPDRLQLQYDAHVSTSADVIGAAVSPFRTDEEIGNGFARYCAWLNGITEHTEITQNIFIEDPIPSPTLFMPMNIIRKVGGYDVNVYPDDYNLTLKNYACGYKFHKVNKTLLYWRDHNERLSRTHPELSNQRFYQIKAKYFKATILEYCKKPIVIWGVGRNGKELYKVFRENSIPVTGFTTIPEFIRNKTLYDCPICEPDYWKNCYFIVATASTGARLEICKHLTDRGLKHGSDFIAFC